MTLDLQQRESVIYDQFQENNYEQPSHCEGADPVVASGGFSYPDLTGNPVRYTQPRGAKMATAAKGHPVVTVSDVLDDHARAVIEFGLAAYNDEKTGYRDYRPLAVVVSDPETGEIVGGTGGPPSAFCLSNSFSCQRSFAATGSAATLSHWRKKRLNGEAAPAPPCSRSPSKRRSSI
jgi:hypothetical protein